MDVLYVATATATGGRVGRRVSSDGNLAVDLVVPPEMCGSGDPGINPEQLFAAGYSACFLSALTLVAGEPEVDASLATVTADDSSATRGNIEGSVDDEEPPAAAGA